MICLFNPAKPGSSAIHCVGLRMAAVLILLTCAPCVADIKVPEGAGPRVDGFNKEVFRGVDNRFMLSKGGKGLGIKIEYSIVEHPKHGKLELLNTNTGEVSYRIDPDPNVREEQFLFRAKDSKGNFSASAKCVLVIIDRRAVVELPKEINFGKVVMNGHESRKLVIENNGNAVFKRKVKAPEGFQLNGRDEVDLNIPAQGKRIVEVRFVAGEKAGKVEVNLVVQRDKPRGLVVLRSEVSPPFQVQAILNLEFDDEDYSRHGELRVINLFKKKLMMELLLPDGLKSDHKNYEIDGDATMSVKLNIPAHNSGGFEGEVKVGDGRISKTVKILAKACPARVVPVEPTGIKNNEILFEGDLNKSNIKKQLKLRNEGGVPANISANVNPPFRLLEGSGAKKLEPGVAFTYNIELKTDKIGEFKEELTIDYLGDPIQVTLKGHVLLPPGMKIPGTVKPPVGHAHSNRAAEKVAGVPLRDILYGRTPVERLMDDAIPSVQKIRVIEQRSNSLVLSWNPQPGGAWEYAIDALVNLKDEETGLPIPTWVEIQPEHLTITRSKSEIRAEIVGIVPGGEYTLRIFTVSQEGGYSLPAALRLAIERKQASFQWFRFWMLPLLGLILCGTVSLVRRIRHERQLYG
jgi:hypothetical protein